MAKHASADSFKVEACGLPGIVAVEATSSRSFGRHTHDQFGIGVVLQGAQDSASGRGDVRAEPGNLITVNPNEVHDGRPVAGTPRSWRMLYLEPALIARFSEELGKSPGSELIHPVLAQRPLAEAFLRLHSALTGPATEPWREIAEQELLLILAPLLDEASNLPKRLPAQEIARARARIDAAPDDPVTLTELAADAGLSRHHFLRAFKATMALPPHAYRLQRQLQMARRLILAGQPLAQAAIAAGFADQSHLTRHFARTYGYTPGSLATALRTGA